jgi:hypothetical protein
LHELAPSGKHPKPIALPSYEKHPSTLRSHQFRGLRHSYSAVCLIAYSLSREPRPETLQIRNVVFQEVKKGRFDTITGILGTKRTWQRSGCMSVIGTTADSICLPRVFRFLTLMYGPAVRCKWFRRAGGERSCINVSGLRLECVMLRAIMDISARATSLTDRPQRAIWVTSVRTRRENRTSSRLILSQTSAGSC